MRLKQKVMSRTGLTLVEAVLALLMSAIVLVPLSTALELCTKSWESNQDRSDMLYEASLVMQGMTAELQHATRIVEIFSTNNVYIKFETRTTEDNTPDIETIIYTFWIGSKRMTRSPDGGSHYFDIAGHSTSTSYVQSLALVAYKDVGGVLTPLVVPPDSYDSVVAVRITLTMKDRNNHSLMLSSLAKLRSI